MYEIKANKVYRNFSKDKEVFYFSNYSAKSKCQVNSNKLVVGKINDQKACASIENFKDVFLIDK